MHDKELMDLFKRLGVAIGVLFLFGVLFVLLIYKRFGAEDPSILRKLDKYQDVFVVVRGESCDVCPSLIQTFKKRKVSYLVFRKDREKRYLEVYHKMGVEEEDILVPSVVYLHEGDAYSILVDIHDEKELDEFIDSNELGK